MPAPVNYIECEYCDKPLVDGHDNCYTCGIQIDDPAVIVARKPKKLWRTIVNCTPHTIKLQVGRTFMVFTPYEKTVRAKSLPQLLNWHNANMGIPVAYFQDFDKEVEGLPVEFIDLDNTAPPILVSSVGYDQVKKAWPHNLVFSPDTGPDSAIRENGQIIGVKRLQTKCY